MSMQSTQCALDLSEVQTKYLRQYVSRSQQCQIAVRRRVKHWRICYMVARVQSIVAEENLWRVKSTEVQCSASEAISAPIAYRLQLNDDVTLLTELPDRKGSALAFSFINA